MAKEETTPKSTSKTANLKSDLNDIAFKNSHIKFLMDENATLRSQIGRKNTSNTPNKTNKLVGLAGLGSSVQLPEGYKKRK